MRGARVHVASGVRRNDVQGASYENLRGIWGRPYILISAASTMASAIVRMDLRNFMLFC